MTAEIHRLPPPKPNLHCAKCGVILKAQCDCGVGYITAGKAAAKAVKEHPEKSDRVIADEIGVGHATVSRARKSTVSNETPEKRKGLDGKSYTAKRKPKHSREVEDHAARMRLDEGKTYEEVTAATGVSEGTLTKAVAREQGLREALADPVVDVTTLSLTAQKKLAAAERQMRRRLEAECAARLRGIDEEIRQKVLTRNQEYLAGLNKLEQEAASAKWSYLDFMARQKKILTKDEYRLIVMCVHADSSISDAKRNEATRLLIAKRFALTGDK